MPQFHARNVFRVALATVLGVVVGVATTSETLAQTSADQKLASLFVRRAHRAVQAHPLPLESVELAILLTQLADELDPDNLLIQRTRLRLADLGERDEMRAELLRAVSRLDPADQIVRLGRIAESLDRFQTVEERTAAYERLLTDENVRRIGKAVSSRLAYQLAQTYRRSGQVAKYADWLGRALAMDQSNKEAAAWAAGYFRQQVDDPYAQAELLVNLLMADPRDIVALSTLGRHLLDHGAYEAAIRIFTVTLDRLSDTADNLTTGVVADLAIAHWGAGGSSSSGLRGSNSALALIDARQRRLNGLAQRQAWNANPALSPTERAQIRSLLPPVMGTIELAIHDSLKETEAVASTLERLILTFEAIRDAMAQAEEPAAPEDQVQNILQRATLRAWFGEDPDAIQALVDEAETIQPLHETARTRFAGWIALHRGDLDQAVQLLGGVAEQDVPSHLGLALAYLETGREREAARAFLEIARSNPGTAVGLWARDRLQQMIGQGLPSSPLAVRLNDLIAGLPIVIDRYAEDASRLVSVRIEPVEVRAKPYEPILFRIQITNNSGFPIGVGTEMPLHPLVAVEPILTFVNMVLPERLTPLVVDIGQRLRLEPRERMETIIDLRHYPVADLIDSSAVFGCNLQLKATSNFRATQRGTIEPDVAGTVSRSRLFRVDGIRPSKGWLEDTHAAIAEPDSPDDLVRLAILTHILTSRITDEAGDLTALVESARQVVPETFAKLDPASQAWLIGVMPGNAPQLEPILQLARTSNEKLVQISYLLHHIQSANDPMLDAARRSEDPQVRRVAEILVADIERRRDAAADRG